LTWVTLELSIRNTNCLYGRIIIREKIPFAAGAQAISDMNIMLSFPGFNRKNIVMAMINIGNMAKNQEFRV
jgi:hypothetical protein